MQICNNRTIGSIG